MKRLLSILFTSIFSVSLFAGVYSVKSPDGKLEAKLSDGKMAISLFADGKSVLENCEISMSTNKGVLGVDAVVQSQSLVSHKGVLKPVYGLTSEIVDEYNQLELSFKNFKLLIRAYNEAIAYRFVTNFSGELIVEDELLNLSSIKATDKVVAHAVKHIATSFERLWLRGNADIMKQKINHNATLPFFFEKSGFKVAVVESAWLEYPGMRIAWRGDGLRSIFAKYPKKLGFDFSKGAYFVRKGGMYLVKETEDYIAKTDGARAFPWRGFIVARNDVDFLNNETVYKLAEPSKIADTSWIKVGTSVWDWWVNWNCENLEIPLGFNDEMCKYYVDFAAKNGIKFVTLDAGWHVGRGLLPEIYNNTENFLNGNPVVDIPAIAKYAESKGVKIVIWAFSKVLYDAPERALDLFKSWGVYGLKLDFNDRDDQLWTRHMENITKLAADRQMVIDWHGCPAPAGFQRTYPNAVNFEAVYGGEVNKFAKAGLPPSHNVDLPFTRMLSGAMDYTSGGMRNKAEGQWSCVNDFPEVSGTRAHMLAHYVLFFEPLKMLSDMPSEYEKFPEQFKFMAEVPTSWDESVALGGKMGEYVAIARRKGDIWYVGGMCDWNGKLFEVDFSKFLPKGTYSVEMFIDGVNAGRVATDCKRKVVKVKSTDKLNVQMKNGGGFVMKIVPACPIW